MSSCILSADPGCYTFLGLCAGLLSLPVRITIVAVQFINHSCISGPTARKHPSTGDAVLAVRDWAPRPLLWFFEVEQGRWLREALSIHSLLTPIVRLAPRAPEDQRGRNMCRPIGACCYHLV